MVLRRDRVRLYIVEGRLFGQVFWLQIQDNSFLLLMGICLVFSVKILNIFEGRDFVAKD